MLFLVRAAYHVVHMKVMCRVLALDSVCVAILSGVQGNVELAQLTAQSGSVTI